MNRNMLRCACLSFILSLSLVATGCGPKSEKEDSQNIEITNTNSADEKGTRDNTPLVLEPASSSTPTLGNELATIDYGNAGEGYILVQYLGNNEKVKLQVTGPNAITYTFSLTNEVSCIPLTSGNGTYICSVYENVKDKDYTMAFSAEIDAIITNEFGPYLYPNIYVNFSEDSQTVVKGQELAASASSDLDVVSNVYNYTIDNIVYDYDKAASVAKGYIPVVDETLASGKGICFDYASLMATMLRSQRIPTRLEIGYAGEAYHAWISVYLEESGWVNGIIRFDGNSWTLMDPTFGASSDEEKLREFIGDGSNYVTNFIY